MDEDEQKELAALVAYLSVEAAATAIFRVTAGQWESIHLNASFKELADVDQELGEVREALQRAQSDEQDVALLHGRNLEGEKWQIRVISSRHCVVTALQSSSLELSGRTGDGREGAKVEVDHPDQDSLDSLDWTRHAVRNASAWIEFVREWDWTSTGIGPMESWSPLLRQYLLHIMSNPEPRLIVFGERMTFIYNEACVEFFGAKHPQVMGQTVREAWPEIWDGIKCMIDSAYGGSSTKLADCPMFLERHGYIEETFWNFAMVPIVDPATGLGVGLIDEITEVSSQVTDERRRVSVRDLSEQIKVAKTLPALWKSVLSSLEAAGTDVPFAILYGVIDDCADGEDGSKSSTNESLLTVHHPKKCVLAGSIGLPSDNPNLTESFSLPVLEQDSSLASHCSQVWESRIAQYICPNNGTLPAWLTDPIPTRSFGDKIRTALVSPLRSAGDEVIGVLVTGVNPRSPLNASYKLFLSITSEIIEKAAALISLPEEQRRAQAITDDITSSLTQQLRLYTLQAEKSEAKFSRMAASSPIGMYMFSSTDGKCLYANDAYLELLGVTREMHAIIARPDASAWEEFVHEEDMYAYSEEETRRGNTHTNHGV